MLPAATTNAALPSIHRRAGESVATGKPRLFDIRPVMAATEGRGGPLRGKSGGWVVLQYYYYYIICECSHTVRVIQSGWFLGGTLKHHTAEDLVGNAVIVVAPVHHLR